MGNAVEKVAKMLHDKHGKMTLSKNELAKELGVSLATITVRMSKGMNLPNYIKPDGPKNSTVSFPITDVAEYLSRTVKVL